MTFEDLHVGFHLQRPLTKHPFLLRAAGCSLGTGLVWLPVTASRECECPPTKAQEVTMVEAAQSLQVSLDAKPTESSFIQSQSNCACHLLVMTQAIRLEAFFCKQNPAFRIMQILE